MNVFKATCLLALVFPVAVAGWLYASKFQAPTAQADATDKSKEGGPLKALDNAARLATPDNEASVRALTEAVLRFHHQFGPVPEEVQEAIKKSITQAEMSYLRGKQSGVKEEDVAHLINQIAERLRLPDFARTSTKQVRVLRMGMAVGSPVFMGRGMTNPPVDLTVVNPEMSPLQAAHLAAMLIDQKFVSPNYQVTPEEWERTFQQKELDRIQQYQQRLKAEASGKTVKYLTMDSRPQNPKRDEMERAFDDGASALNPLDALELMNSCLTSLGIGK